MLLFRSWKSLTQTADLQMPLQKRPYTVLIVMLLFWLLSRFVRWVLMSGSRRTSMDEQLQILVSRLAAGFLIVVLGRQQLFTEQTLTVILPLLSRDRPAGTLSGAPKVRAMQLIAAAEGERRGLYGGAVGYLGAAQVMVERPLAVRIAPNVGLREVHAVAQDAACGVVDEHHGAVVVGRAQRRGGVALEHERGVRLVRRGRLDDVTKHLAFVQRADARNRDGVRAGAPARPGLSP